MLSPRAYLNSRPDGFGVLETANGTEDEHSQLPRFVPLKRTELRGEVVGPLASLTLTQIYGYRRDQCAETLEAHYRFPLPGDAAVIAVKVRFGEVEIEAELKPRAEAEACYEQAKEWNQQAALLTRESPDVFTLQIAGIQPDQEIAVETSYVQLARADGIGWSLRVPLTTAPRYVREDEAGSHHAHGQPLGLLRDPGHRFRLDLDVVGAGSVESPTHRLALAGDQERRKIRLAADDVIPDRDLVVRWQPPQAPERPVLRVVLSDDGSDWVYFLAQVAPPAAPDASDAAPAGREVVLLVDHSGSMGGAKWAAADWAVKRFLSDLTERDSFALGLFHDTTRWLTPAPIAAANKVVARANRFLEAHRDSGGTELGVALEQALGLARARGQLARHVLVVTDAQVSDEGRILRLAEEEYRRADRRRISVLCIDAAPNSFLVHQLAEQGGGVARFLTSSPEEEDISTALDEVLADWARPVALGLRLEVNQEGVEAAGRQMIAATQPGWSAVDLGDLPAGRSVWVVGRVAGGGAEDLAFRLVGAAGETLASHQLARGQHAVAPTALKAIFGAWRVLGLEFLADSRYTGKNLADQLRRLGYDPEEVFARGGQPPQLYAENARLDEREALRGLLAREALRYGLASSETAFVATRAERGKRVEGTVLVANCLPSGWSGEFALAARARSFAAPPSSQIYFTAAAPVSMSAPSPTFSFALQAAEPDGDEEPRSTMVFSGTPQFVGGEVTLFDTSLDQDADKLPEETLLSRLVVRFPGGTPSLASVKGLLLLIYVGDLTTPRARVGLVDLLRQRSERPINIMRRGGERVLVALADAAGTWKRNAPRVEVEIGW